MLNQSTSNNNADQISIRSGTRRTMQPSSASVEQLNANEKDQFFSNEEGDVAMEDLQINTGERQKKQNSYNVLFRCTIVSQRNQSSSDTDKLILDLLEPYNVELKESSAQRELIFTYKKEDILNEIVAFNDNPNSTLSHLSYFDSLVRGWRQIKQDEVKFSSNKIYRIDMINQEINNGPNNDQGFTEDWIIDIKVKEKLVNNEGDNLLLPAIRQADQRIEELEQLVLSIGLQIVEHFQPNNEANIASRQNQITNECNRESPNGMPEEACQESTEEDQNDSDTVSEGLIRDQSAASKVGEVLKRQNTDKDKNRDSFNTKVSPSTIQSRKSLSKQNQISFGPLVSNKYVSMKQQTHRELMLQNRQTSSVHPHPHSGKLDHLDSLDQLQIANLSMLDKSKSHMEKPTKSPSLAHTRSNNSTLDLAYIYADPLLLEVQIKGANRNFQKILVDFNQPLEIDQEFDKISECIRKTKRKFTITKKVATSDNLKSVMGSRPQMIHISCHGDCIQEKSGKSTYYLAFEEVERFCVLDQLTEERLRKLLGKNDEHGVKVVFVSACHSEMIGQIFKRVGVPVVIAVNQLTPILDDVCRKFSRHFYEHLVQGNTPKQAFKAGKDAVKGARHIDVYSCCCAHKHKIWCKWDKHFKQLEKDKHDYDKDLPHNLHIPNSVEQNCKCPKKSNIHRGKCEYYKKFKEQFFPTDTELQSLKLDIFNWENYDNRTMQLTAKVCCCSPEIPHNETQKFMIIKRNFEKEREEAKIRSEEAKKKQANNMGEMAPENPSDDDELTQAADVNEETIQQIDNYYLNHPLFKNREEGMLEVQGNMDCYNQLKQMLDTDMLIGRNLVIKDIVQNISEHHRILHVFGSGGMGKSDIVNFAAKYALYGRVELDGAIYVDIDNKETVNALIQSICKRLSERIILPANQGEYQIEDIIRIISQYKYLIVMDNLRSLISKNKIEFNKFLQDLLDRTQKTKIIVISDQNDDVTPVKGTSSHISIEKKQSIEIKELLPLHAAQLMMKIASGSQYLKEFKNDVELSKHEIFTKIPLKPTGIVQTAQLIMHQSLDSIVQRKDQQIKQQQEEIEKKLKEAVCQAFVNGIKNQPAEVKQTDLKLPINATLPKQFQLPEEEKKEVQLAVAASNVMNVQNQFDDMSFILKLTFEELMKEYPVENFPYEYQLLYILCLMPSGLFENDIEFLCQMRKNYGDWRGFFAKISQEGKNNKGMKSLTEKEQEDGDHKMEQLQIDNSEKDENKKVFKFLQLSFNQDLEQELFVPVPLVRDYILSQLGELPQFKDKVKDYFMLCLKFLANLSRKFLRARAEDIRNEIDHKVITAAIDLGIWHDDYGVNISNQTSMNTSSFSATPNFMLDQSMDQRDHRKVHHLELSQVYEANFTTFLDLDMLKQKFQSLSYLQDDASGDIQELCICVVSYLIEWGEFETAQLYLDKCNLIAQHFNMKPLEAKLILLQTSLTYKRKQDPKLEELEELLPRLQIAAKVFTENKTFGKFKDALAETLYMQALILTSICHKQINPLREQIIQESKQDNSKSEAVKPQMLQVDQQFHRGKISGDINLALKKLENSRNFFEEAGIKFGVAKCCLVEAEFILDLFLDTVTEFGGDIEKTEFDLINRVEEAIILFGELKFEGLSANAYKLRGILCERKYQEALEQDQNELNTPNPTTTSNPGGMISSKKQKISMFDPVEYLIEAKEAYEKSIEKYTLIREQNQILSVNIKLEILIEKLQKKSSNMLIFAKAAPLVENCQEQFGRNSMFSNNILPFSHNPDFKSVGISTRYSTRFRKNVAQEAQKSGQQINVKFDQLNKELLDYVKDHGCKLLHLCSQVFDEFRLCLEDKNGVADYLTIDNLTRALLPDNPHHSNSRPHHNHNHICSLKVQLVVLAVPLSTQLAQAFVTMGVPHVVSFGYESFVKHPILIPHIQNLISNFCFRFYQKLFANTINVKQAFEQTVNECYDSDSSNIIDKLWQIERIEGLVLSQYDDLLQQGPKLHPQESRTHEKLLFTSLTVEQKQKADLFIDSSKKRTPTNHMSYMRFSFTGRRAQIFELVQNLTGKQRLINICGPQGLGKTAFVLQTAHFLAYRNLYTDGIVYSDMKDVSTTQEFKDRLKETMIEAKLIDEKDDLGNQLKKDNSLHIFDNVESIINNKGEFDWSIVNLLTVYENMRIIVISRNELKLDNIDLLLIKNLPPLTDEESVDLIQSNCERQIMEDLMDEQQSIENFEMESVSERRGQRRGSNRLRKQVKRINIYEYLRNDKNFQQCGGFPDLLLLLAKELSSKNLADINLKKALGIENQKRIDEISIYKHTINQKAKILKQQEMQTFAPFEQAVPQDNDGGESPSFNNNTSMSQVGFPQEEDLFARLQNTSQWVEDFNDSKRRGSIPQKPKGYGSSSQSSNVNLLHRQQTSRFAGVEEEEKKEEKKLPPRRGTVVMGQNNAGNGMMGLNDPSNGIQPVPSWNNYIPQTPEEEENQMRIAILQSQQEKYYKFKKAPTLSSLFDASQDLISSPLNQSPMQSPALSRVNSTTQPQQQVTNQSSQSYKKRPYTKVQTGSNSSQQKQGSKKDMKDSEDNNM